MGALPSGAQEQIGPKGRYRVSDGSAPYLFRSFDTVDDFTSNIKKNRPGPPVVHLFVKTFSELTLIQFLLNFN